MSWFKERNEEVNSEVASLKENVRILEERIRAMNAEKEDTLVKEMANASFAINWDSMKAFSVERMREGAVTKTIIGYILEEPVVVSEDNVTTKDVVREWTLYCSIETHEKLVAEFNEWKKGKKK